MQQKLTNGGQDRKVLPFGCRVVGALLISLLVPGAARAQNDQWQLGATPTFLTGRYGTDARTDIVYTPFVARRLFADGDLTLVVPFICITGEGGVTVVGGSPVRTERTDAARGGDDSTVARAGSTERTGRSAAADGTGSTSAPLAPQRERNCGIGDLVVRGRYYFLDQHGVVPTIAVRAHVKAPTADANRDLGTGKPDEGIGLEISRSLGGGLMAMVDGGYTFIGKPAGAEFRNTWWYDVGLGQDLAGGVLNVSVFFERYRAIVPGVADARDILAAVSVRTSSGWRVQFAGEFGLSDGAPDHGVTFGASRRF